MALIWEKVQLFNVNFKIKKPAVGAAGLNEVDIYDSD